MNARRCVVSLLSAVFLLVAAAPSSAAPADTIADAVLGQPNFNESGCDKNNLGPAGMCTPYDAAVDPTSGRLYVVELDSHRVLSWASATSFANGTAADLVFGQRDFWGNRCNAGGISASSLCKPAGVVVDRSGNVYIGDHRNNRLLEYDTPATTDTVADRVWGQPDFKSSQCDSGGISADTLCGPRNPGLDPAGNLWISDHQNHRVLAYRNPLSSDHSADLVIGQPDFATQNCGVGPTSLCHPRAVELDKAGTLYVADAYNQRVLAFLDPFNTDRSADDVYGQKNYTAHVCNAGGVNAGSLCGPRDVAVDDLGHVFIADTRNNRVLIYNSPMASDNLADRVLGQPNMTTGVCNNGGITATSMCEPRGLGADAAGNVYVPDSANDRLLRFDRPA